jgi:putative OPT family oligopeptide transporter
MSFGVCVVGGVLGVMYTIPLRRALVTASDLPYPEGVAAAEVLKVGAGSRQAGEAEAEAGDAGLLTIVAGSVVSALFAALVAAKLFATEVGAYVRLTATSATGIGGSLSLALLGAGHLMGIAVGLAMGAGLVIAWGIATPILTAMYPVAGPAADVAVAVWKTKVRFIGAGAIGAAALWTLGRLAAPVWAGVTSAIRASVRSSQGEFEVLPRAERDLPIWVVAATCIICVMPMTGLIQAFVHGKPMILKLVVGSVLYIIVAGFLVAAVCGYMAGLIGSSNSPVSGLAILAVLGAAVLLVVLARGTLGPAGYPALVAFALFVTSLLIAVATIANDNLQDLKTGQLVDATPWRQQIALLIGVVAGAAVIPPILDLLNKAYGFAGAPNIHAIANQPLPAPQATLISALAKGVVEGQLDWGLIGVGALVGAVLIAIDELLRLTGRYSLPPLGVGMAIYLPSSVTMPIVVGALAGWLYDKAVGRATNPHAAAAKRMGILMASGLIVGESLFNVALAGLIVASNKGEPLALVGDAFAGKGIVLGLCGALVSMAALYGFSAASGKRGAAGAG